MKNKSTLEDNKEHLLIPAASVLESKGIHNSKISVSFRSPICVAPSVVTAWYVRSMRFISCEKCLLIVRQGPPDLQEVIAYSSLASSICTLPSNRHHTLRGSQNGTTFIQRHVLCHLGCTTCVEGF